MKVNEIIRARRKELGLTLKQVADKLGDQKALYQDMNLMMLKIWELIN